MNRHACRCGGFVAVVAWVAGTASAGSAWAGEPQVPPTGSPVAPAGPPAVLGPSGGADILDRGRADRAPPILAAPTPTSRPSGSTTVVSEAQNPAFMVKDVQVVGATAPSALVRAAVTPFIGKRLDANGAGTVADALAAAYARSDVAISTVVLPRQSFKDGIVRLRVIEGRLEAIDVQANDPRLVHRARALTASLLGQQPLRRAAFDRAMILVQSIPGVTAKIDFVRGSRTGLVRLSMRLKVRRLKGGVGVSDRGQNLLGRTQLSAVAELNSLLRAGDQTSLVLAAPTDFRRFRYIGLTHNQPVGASGATVQVSLGRLETHPRGSSTSGEATIASVQASYPLILTAKRSLTLTGSLDSLDSSNALLGQTITNERTRALRGAAAFAQSFDEGKGSASAGLTLSQGLDGLGARVLAPGYAHADFHKLTLQAAASHAYGKWTVRLRATAQAADGTIPASEQISLGGDDFGRAFEAGVATGDDGAAASAELAYAPKLSRPVLKGLEAYIFTDAGRTRTLSRPALRLAGRTSDLASVGFGARVTVAQHTALQAEIAHPLVDDTPYAKGGDWRLIVGLRTSY